MNLKNTIAAISTPLGEAGIGIVRISGDGAIPIAEKIFRLPSGAALKEKTERSIVYGYIITLKMTKELTRY